MTRWLVLLCVLLASWPSLALNVAVQSERCIVKGEVKEKLRARTLGKTLLDLPGQLRLTSYGRDEVVVEAEYIQKEQTEHKTFHIRGDECVMVPQLVRLWLLRVSEQIHDSTTLGQKKYRARTIRDPKTPYNPFRESDPAQFCVGVGGYYSLENDNPGGDVSMAFLRRLRFSRDGSLHLDVGLEATASQSMPIDLGDGQVSRTRFLLGGVLGVGGERLSIQIAQKAGLGMNQALGIDNALTDRFFQSVVEPRLRVWFYRLALDVGVKKTLLRDAIVLRDARLSDEGFSPFFRLSYIF